MRIQDHLPHHVIALARELAAVHRGELVLQLHRRKGIFADTHPDTLEIRRKLELANELCAALGGERAAA